MNVAPDFLTSLCLAEPLINFRLTSVYQSTWSRMFWKGVRREFWSGGFPAESRFQKTWRKSQTVGCGLRTSDNWLRNGSGFRNSLTPCAELCAKFPAPKL